MLHTRAFSAHLHTLSLLTALCRVPSAYVLFLCFCRSCSLCIGDHSIFFSLSQTSYLPCTPSRIDVNAPFWGILPWHPFSPTNHSPSSWTPHELELDMHTPQFQHWSHSGLSSICISSSLEKQWAFSKRDLWTVYSATDTQPIAWEHGHCNWIDLGFNPHAAVYVLWDSG